MASPFILLRLGIANRFALLSASTYIYRKNVFVDMEKEFVVGIGELLWDMLPGGRRLGGAPANFAYHVSQFGLESVLVSAVGRDEAGEAAVRELVETMSAYPLPGCTGLTDSGVSKGQRLGPGFNILIGMTDFPTGTVGVELDADGVPRYDIRMQVAWDNIPWTSALRQLASRTRAVCFGTLARRSPVSCRTVSRFVDAVPAGEGQWRILDINLRQHFYTRDVVMDALRQCNILKINEEELTVLSGMLSLTGVDSTELCRRLMHQFDLKILILTCGVQGSYVFASGGEDVSFLDTPKVKVVDTVGAGDSFTAAFASALIRGLSIQEAHRLAVNLSAYVCSCEGAMPVLPEGLRAVRH